MSPNGLGLPVSKTVTGSTNEDTNKVDRNKRRHMLVLNWKLTFSFEKEN